MKLTRTLGAVAGVLALTLGLTACTGGDSADDQTIRVGTSPGPYSVLFKEGIDPILTSEGWTIEYTDFSDLQQADTALQEGSVDLNVDQHTAYMDVFNREKKADLASITEVPTVPAGLYSERHDSLDQVGDGQTVGIPQDASNASRAYNILADAGWITLNPDADPALLGENDIASNPHNLDIQVMDSATIPRALTDLDWGVIPGSMSYASKVDPNLQLFQETLRPELILVAATRADQVDSEWAQAVASAYRSPEFLSFVEAENVNSYWFIPESLK
ncbi:metal ABC transporter substrate-binding protein [Corynebacterium testudinoris]|uniref:ABC-type metal ion transport system, periplasmic component/surface antigen n=1 Tax=Corynebacterium testudinoris TaxID=136857 RepID=A0A0G3H294_9CORY|nr:MetQ/NlpA family ABC transporter substrate-binding protein [Corynebacterium testudinoris]AKK07534.1 ABC-type metal ion transport system, periplasmic component/surface antigen [Corynebacterium testudinoris]MBX8995035.1 metal ABC transporter substrate-binding protein [Corynebacterium testudinoris]